MIGIPDVKGHKRQLFSKTMNIQKDINPNNGQNVNHLQGQTLERGNSVVSLKNVNELTSPRKDISYSFLVKKTQKLVGAVYLVTGYISDTEPLKWSMRECSVSVLSDVAKLKDTSSSEVTNFAKKILSDTKRIESFLGLAEIAGYLSAMNAMILVEEFRSLSRLIESKKSEWSESGFVFAREFFTADAEREQVSLKEEHPIDFSKGHVKDKEYVSDKNKIVRNTEQTNPLVSETQRKDIGQIKKDIIKETPKKVEKNSRRESIIDLVKGAGEVSIKDIVSHFPDCGEKTIQRELVVLVQNNVLKKTGDRRWSRYSVV